MDVLQEMYFSSSDDDEGLAQCNYEYVDMDESEEDITVDESFRENSFAQKDLKYIMANIVDAEDTLTANENAIQCQVNNYSSSFNNATVSGEEEDSVESESVSSEFSGASEIVLRNEKLEVKSRKLRDKDVIDFTLEEEENGPIGPLRTKNEITDANEIFSDSIEECIASISGISVIEEGDFLALSLNSSRGTSLEDLSSSLLEHVGDVHYFVDGEHSVVVQSNLQKTLSMPLDEGSLVCICTTAAEGDPSSLIPSHPLLLGKVTEVFGPVAAPFYVVKLPRSRVSRSAQDRSESTRSPRAGNRGSGNRAQRRMRAQEMSKKKVEGEGQDSSPSLAGVQQGDLVHEGVGEGLIVVQEGEVAVECRENSPSPLEEDHHADHVGGEGDQSGGQGVEEGVPAPGDLPDPAIAVQVLLRPVRGDRVFALKEKSQYLTPALLMNMRMVKGSDASNIHDEEVSSHVVYSSPFLLRRLLY